MERWRERERGRKGGRELWMSDWINHSYGKVVALDERHVSRLPPNNNKLQLKGKKAASVPSVSTAADFFRRLDGLSQ